MAIEYSSLKRVVESEGIRPAEAKITKILKEAKAKISDVGISLKGLWESLVGRVDETLHQANSRESGFISTKQVQEAEVRSSAFSNITGVLIANEVIAGYEGYPAIGDELVQTPYYQTTQQGERYPGFTAHERPGEIDEGQPYPEAGFGDKYVTIAELKKMGRIILVTEEAIMRDQTGILQERCKMIAEALAEEKELRILDAVCGHKACYYPQGAVQLLYAAAPYKIGSNALVDYTDIEKCENDGLAAMVDEGGRKINAMPRRPIILVPRALYRTAKRIVQATDIEYGASTDTIRAKGKNPLSGENIMVLTSVNVSTYTGNNTSWFYGDPKRQFRYKQYYPLQVFTLPTDSYELQRKDCKFAYKIREWGFPFAVDQKYFILNES